MRSVTTRSIFIFSLLWIPHPANAQYKKLCCSCTSDQDHHRFIATTALTSLPNGIHPCQIACTSNFGSENLTERPPVWMVDEGEACPPHPQPTQPRQPNAIRPRALSFCLAVEQKP
jgi:hypothetical protein